jgi:hypothetical protein
VTRAVPWSYAAGSSGTFRTVFTMCLFMEV